MSDSRFIENTENSDHVYEVAQRIISSMRSDAVMLTGEGWDLAYAVAIMRGDTHTAVRIKDAKGLAMYRGEDR